MGISTSKQEQGEKLHGRLLKSQGLYDHIAVDYNKRWVRKLIATKKLAPFYPGHDGDKNSNNADASQECPICYLTYPTPLNHSKCCQKPICTECFVQIKRQDPMAPPSCPFCARTNYAITYSPVVRHDEGLTFPTLKQMRTTAVSPREPDAVLADDLRLHHRSRMASTSPFLSVYTSDTLRRSSFENLLIELAMQRSLRHASEPTTSTNETYLGTTRSLSSSLDIHPSNYF
ncbi:hypothetical protein DM01DRAFT_1331964 [Hesseltinella vesiculosa]|uniref:RING-type domain-containing protein n=1 Tax=Hesseltinella vesiculosa TaxID=101127 RepID=A0A1X2GTI2_9FUNG|nr:hypothetical protein DM01DRAFT_1331964 [Hesseltinella vesiculosa]